MSGLNFMLTLLGGVEVTWMPLADVVEFKRGEQLKPIDIVPGAYPIVTASKTEVGSHSKWNFGPNSVTVTSHGAYAGHVNYWSTPIWLANNVFLLSPTINISQRYLYFFLKSNESKVQALAKGGGVPYFNTRDLAPFLVPIPCPDSPPKSLEIQAEIVRILDTFTQLTAELTAELTARRKQYLYYRDRLLSFEGADVEWRTLGEVVKTVTAPSKLKTQAYCAEGKLPIIDQGIQYIAGYTNEDIMPVEAGKYIIFGDHSEHIKYVDFSFVQGADGIKILRPISSNAKYIFYAFENFYKKELSYKRHWSTAQETLIPIPSIPEQARIVAILDKFDALTNSLTEGLPREIELRQKQYEHYRDLLLSFPKPDEVET